MDEHSEPIVDLDNQDYNQEYDYQHNGVDNYMDHNAVSSDNMLDPNQIDSTLGITE